MNSTALKIKNLKHTTAWGVCFAVIWSGSFVATKLALADIHPLWLVEIRLAAAGMIFLLLTRKSTVVFWEKATPRCWIEVVLSGLLSQAVYLGGTCWALVTLPTSVVAIIVAALPLASIPMAFLILKEKISLMGIVAAVFGLIGVAIVAIERDSRAMSQMTLFSTPVLLTLTAVITLATGNALVKPYVSLKNIGAICTMQMLSASIALLPFLFYFNEGSNFSVSHKGLMALSYLIFIGSVAGAFIWLKILQIFSAKSASGFFLLTPLISILIGVLFLDEKMTPLKILGAAIVSGSILFNAGHYILQSKSKI